jgi:hypothetical protein
MTVKHVSRDVRPKFTKGIGRGIAQYGVSKFGGHTTRRAILRGVVRRGDALGYTTTQKFRDVEAVMALVVGRYRYPRDGVQGTFPDAPFALGEITLVLMKNSGQSENDQVIAVRLVNESAPIITSKAWNTLPELGMSIISFGDHRSKPHENERRIVEGVLGSNPKSLLGGGGRRDRSSADGAVIRHNAEDSFGLSLVRRDGLAGLIGNGPARIARRSWAGLLVVSVDEQGLDRWLKSKVNLSEVSLLSGYRSGDQDDYKKEKKTQKEASMIFGFIRCDFNSPTTATLRVYPDLR